MAVNVADLAGQVQDHACQSDRPIWAPQGSHPSTSLIGEITVWQAANGINPQDLRPTGGTQLETLPALWKERLDRDIARATYPPADARADARQAAHTPHLDAGMTTASANTKNRNDAQGGPRLADSTPTRRIRTHRALPSLALSDQGPGFTRPAGACPSFAAGPAVWVSAPRGSGGRRLLN
jgi:hypothetical protein